MRAIALALALLTALLSFDEARSDPGPWQPIDRRTDLAQQARVRARYEAAPGRSDTLAFGYVKVQLVNPQAEAHWVFLAIRNEWGDQDASVRRIVDLAPGDDTTVDLPLFTQAEFTDLEIRLDGVPAPTQGWSWGSGPDDALYVLLVSEQRARRARAWWFDQLERGVGKVLRVRPPSTTDVHFEVRAAQGLPSRWQYLTAFDLVVVDVAGSSLEDHHVRTLLRYVAGGGQLALLGGQVLDDERFAPLARDLAGASQPVPLNAYRGWYGLGRWIVLPSVDPADISAEVEAWLEPPGPLRMAHEDRPRHTETVPAALWGPLAIPGLGEVPVQSFFLLILAFAILVGPVSYIVLKRRRRLAWLLVTIPAAGFLCTAVILLYGFFSEGFGVSGVVRSFTILDQRAHQAVTCSGRRLYAGLSPSALEVQSDTFLSGLAFDPNVHPGRAPTWHLDVDSGRLDGSVLPSRTPTAFTTATVTHARERLRFERREEGGFDVRYGPELRPVLAPHAILLRTLDGRFYVTRGGSGRLVPLEPSHRAGREIRSVLAPLARMELRDPEDEARPYRSRSPFMYAVPGVEMDYAGALGFQSWLEQRLEYGMPPGSYLARVEQAPALDDLGLDVNYRAREHVVLGVLSAEDIIE